MSCPPRPRILRLLPGTLLLGLLTAALASAQEPDSARVASPGEAVAAESAQALPDPAALTEALRAAGLENLSVTLDSAGVRLAFENRRYRHTATALGVVARLAPLPLLAFERRLGLVSAAIPLPADGSAPTTSSHPSDGTFPAFPSAPALASTRGTLDLLAGPLFTYELPLVFDPAKARIEIQGELRYQPWTGGLFRGAVIVPVKNEIEPDEFHPDGDRVRPGPVLLEQFAWSPHVLLFSAAGGILGNNRYGLSVGVARPLAGGRLLLDAQTDVTGFFALTDSGATYSTPSRWTGFAGVTWRPPRLDLGVRLRAARFLQEDQGLELELKRSMHDVDVALYGTRFSVGGEGVTVGGIRVSLPVPPFERPVGSRIRVLPIERFQISYRDDPGAMPSAPLGEGVPHAPSREEYLRHLNPSSLEANAERYRAARSGESPRRRSDGTPVNLTGMTGFVHTPWCGVMSDRDVELGYNRIPKEASYEGRDRYPNEIYYASLGFLPRVELGLRWTVIPGANPFLPLVPESPAVDADRMFSGRVALVEPREGRPGLAIGAEDVRGTRRFHSSYAVAGLPFRISRLQNRVTLGYAPRVFKDVSGRTLDGLFGACEVSPPGPVSLTFENDSKRWSAMLGIDLWFGLRTRLALLDLKHTAFGAGWFHAL